MQIEAYAKINWSLAVVGLREDGYHLLDMLMQRISLRDTLEIKARKDSSVLLEIHGKTGLKADQHNLIYKAATLLKKESGYQKGAEIRLTKRIPMGAGLGGGSADAAAVFKALNQLWGLGLSQDELERLGLRLGADIPFCLRGGFARVGGIGEKIESQKGALNYWLVIIKAGPGLQTREVFTCFDRMPPQNPLEIERLIPALKQKNWTGIKTLSGNHLEGVSSSLCAGIPQALKQLKAYGAQHAMMTGSGSAVFGVFSSHSIASHAARALKRRYRECYLVSTLSD